MDWNATPALAEFVAAVAAIVAALSGLFSWRLQRANYRENQMYKERLRLEERHFKLHVLWQELRIASVTLQSIPEATAEYAPLLDALPIAQITEAIATKDLLHPEATTKVRIARDDLVQLEQLAGDARSPEVRKTVGFERRFAGIILKTLSSLDEARQAIISQLPG